MAHQLVHTIRQIARHETQQRWAPALGVVTSVFGANSATDYACTVELRELGIVLPRVPIATNLIGAAALPREEDLVVVVFAGGDLHAPIVVGRLYNEAVAPPKIIQENWFWCCQGMKLQPTNGLELRINTPGDGTRAATLTLDGQVKTTLTIDDEGIRVEVGDTTLSLKQTNGSNGTVEISAGEAKITLKQGGELSLETSGKLTIKGASVEISGDTTVKIGGQTVNIN